nr:MAG TPA: hypothetical protein [Caudoviricetes sp.]
MIIKPYIIKMTANVKVEQTAEGNFSCFIAERAAAF